MGKKVNINKFRQAQNLIGYLEEMTERARNTEVMAFAVVTVDRKGNIGTQYSRGYNCNSKMIGALEQLKYRLITE